MQQALTFSILQLKKLRHGEAMYFAQVTEEICGEKGFESRLSYFKAHLCTR